MRRNINIWKNLDWPTVFIYLILILVGWINIYAAVYSEEHSSILDFQMRYGKQLLWIFASVLLIIIILSIDTKAFSFFAYILYGISLLILITVLFVGKEINATRAWFQIGSFSLQPSEFAKITTALTIAKYLSSYNIKIENYKTWIILGIIILFPAFLIFLEPDVGSGLVFLSFVFAFYREGFPGGFLFFGFMLIFLIILSLMLSPMVVLITIIIVALISLFVLRWNISEVIIGGISIICFYLILFYINKFFLKTYSSYQILLAAFGIAGITGLITLFFKKIQYLFWVIILSFIATGFTYSIDYVFDKFLQPHQQQRINILLGKESDPKGAEYNVNQSKIAIGSGGFFGKGFLQGTQTKYNFVPEQSTDFIFCTVGEEWGFVGSFFVIALFTLLILRILYLSERQRSAFSRIYGYCVASILFFHVAINIGMTIGIIPVIGIPLPFFSYGGSSLWAFSILLFIFLRLDASRLEMLR